MGSACLQKVNNEDHTEVIIKEREKVEDASVPLDDNKGKTASEQVEHKKGKIELPPLPDLSNTFPMSVVWQIDKDGHKMVLPIQELLFSKTECKCYAKGTDDIGQFVVVGNFNLEGTLLLTFTHENPEENKEFRGKLEDGAANGEWANAAEQTGSFSLQFVATIWLIYEACLCLRSRSELQGIGQFPYGWAVVVGQSEGEETSPLHLQFADGNTGTFMAILTEQSASGKVTCPTGEVSLYLLPKNEFG